MHVAVIFSRFGPYHIARLEAAGRHFASLGGTITGIEVARTDALYAWTPVAGGERFRKVTLFDHSRYQDVPPGRLDAALSALLDKLRPDGVAIPGWSAPEALAALRWAGHHAVPAVLLSESARIDASRTRLAEALKRRLVRRCGAALVGGQRHADYLVDLGMPANRIALGYDSVDNSHFAHGADEARSDGTARREALGLPGRYFLASCRFIPKKNLSRLLEAFGSYRSRTSASPWDLVLCGDGELRAELEAQATRLGLRAAVHFAGFAGYDALPAYYGLAGAFIQSSTVEQWGLVVNEAAAAGLPLLVSEPSGCVTELVESGRNGFTFDPANVEELAALMTGMAEGQWDLTIMGAASRTIVSAWGVDRFAQGLAEAVELAASQSAQRPSLPDRLLIRLMMKRWR